MDFFSGVRLGKQIGDVEFGMTGEFGINRTFFQSRLYPRISIGVNYFLLDREKFRFGPAVSYSYSMLQVNKSAGSWHKWNEIYGGYTLSVGDKWRFSHSLMAGWMNERYRSQISQKMYGTNTLGFYLKFGLEYAW
jgi:hypothetical protein